MYPNREQKCWEIWGDRVIDIVLFGPASKVTKCCGSVSLEMEEGCLAFVKRMKENGFVIVDENIVETIEFF